MSEQNKIEPKKPLTDIIEAHEICGIKFLKVDKRAQGLVDYSVENIDVKEWTVDINKETKEVNIKIVPIPGREQYIFDKYLKW